MAGRLTAPEKLLGLLAVGITLLLSMSVSALSRREYRSAIVCFVLGAGLAYFFSPQKSNFDYHRLELFVRERRSVQYIPSESIGLFGYVRISSRPVVAHLVACAKTCAIRRQLSGSGRNA